MKRGQTVLGIVLSVLLVVVLVIGLGWLFEANDLAMFGFYAPKYANVQRNVYENTHSYNRGMETNLQQLHGQYITATPTQQAAIGALALQEVADDAHPELLSLQTQAWLDELRTKRGGY